MNLLREVILRKKLLPFGHCQKGGGGAKFKSFGVFFLVLLLDILEERRGGGLNLFQKFWGSFEVVFR